MAIQDGAIVRVPMDTLPTLRVNPSGTITSTASTAGGGMAQIADRLVNYACRVRRTNPELWENMVDRTANFVSGGIINTAWQTICQPFDNANPGDGAASSQIVGGQCSVNYTITWQTTQLNGATAGNGFVTLPGPIRSVTLPVTQSGLFRIWSIRIVYGPSSLVYLNQVYSQQSPSGYIGAWNYTIVRQDGLPDNCGDAPPRPLPPTPPSTTGTVNIQLGPQTVTVPVSIGGPTMPNYPDIEFTPELVLNGDINVNITPSEVVFRFPEPLPGFPIESLPSLNPVIELTPTLELLSGNTVNIQNDVSIIRDIVEEGVEVDLTRLETLIRACCCSPEYEYSSEVLATNTRGGTFELPANTIAVGIQKSAQAVNAPVQSGEGIIPNCSPTAWISFGYGGKPGVREYGSWDESAFPIPKDCDTFVLLGIYNTRYNIVAIIKEKVVPP